MNVFKHLKNLDWILIIPIILIMMIGLITNFNINDEGGLFFKQSIFVSIGIIIMLSFSHINYSFLRGPFIPIVLYIFGVIVLSALLLFAPTINGANSWFVLGNIAIQPVEFVKLILIIVLARYFATRHINIRHLRHIFVSLLLTIILFVLVLKQPDLGSSIIFISIWAGILFVSGVSKKHIVGLFILIALIASIGYQFIPTYQQERIVSFFEPLENLQTTGYTAYQSKIAVGSGEIIGKGIGEGTQSKLGFLPLYESDFIFAAFSEEWGFLGVLILLSLYVTVFFRLTFHAIRGRTNFETLFCIGVLVLIFSHVLMHIGVNIGVFPVTGITLPFMSYGGSHILVESLLIAIVLSMAKNELFDAYEEIGGRKIKI